MFFAGLDINVPQIMGIVNVTPDSFSDGGETFDGHDAVIRGIAMRDAGATILDVGGESTRPGAEEVNISEELRRVIPVIKELSSASVLVSIDTRHAQVMKEAVNAGASIINDVTALEGDPESLGVAAALDVPVILMHMQGVPGTMQKNPAYKDAPQEVFEYLALRVVACLKAGISLSNIAVDPGIGFGKTVEHNLEILNRIDLYHQLKCPIVLGASRKSFISKVSWAEKAQDRMPGSVATALSARQRGVQIFRVHDVAETSQALDVFEAINNFNNA